jgi:hypothetical protein
VIVVGPAPPQAPVTDLAAAHLAASPSRNLSPEPGLRERAAAAHARALAHLRGVQQPKGALAGEVVWNPMLVCQYVILCEILGKPIAPERARRIRRSLELQVRSDGGWGMHPDSASWLFHTTLAYVALRLLGAPPEDPLALGARPGAASGWRCSACTRGRACSRSSPRCGCCPTRRPCTRAASTITCA